MHNSIFYNSQELETAEVPISKWVDQKTVVHLHMDYYAAERKEGAPTLHDSMNGTGEHYAKWSKPGKYHMISPINGT